MPCDATTLDIENFVTRTYEHVPLTGVYSVDLDIEGWEWDKRLLENIRRDSTRYTELGGHIVGLKDGTKLDHWQSGSILNTDFLHLDKFKVVGELLTWTPVVKAGSYSVYFNPKPLYSDLSYVSKVNLLLKENGLFYHQLKDDARSDTASMILYQRDDKYLNVPWHTYKQVSSFTGKLTEDLVRLAVEDDDGDFLVDNLNERLREFTVKDDRIYTNQDPTVVIGDDSVPDVDKLKCAFERKGTGNSDGRNCFTDYFPVADKTVKVYVVNDDVITKWKEVKNLYFSKPTEEHFTVDHDLGIIALGGYKAPNAILREPLAIDDTEVVCFIDDLVFQSYPPQGIIQIGDEQILYYSKGRRRFYDCVRGYNDTLPAEYLIGTVVSDVQHGKAVTEVEHIYIGYTGVPRIEYEVTDSITRSANKFPYLDVKAISNTRTNNIIQINPSTTNVCELEIETDKDHLGGDLYGPLYYGTDVARIIARALDCSGSPVEGHKVTLDLCRNLGNFSGMSSFAALTNTEGEIFNFFNVPYDWESMKKDIILMEHIDGDTHVHLGEDLPPGVLADEIYLYQVLKHDPIMGTQGEKLKVHVDELTGETRAWNDPDGRRSNLGRRCAIIDIEVVELDAMSKWESPSLNASRRLVVLGAGGLEVYLRNDANDLIKVRREIMEVVEVVNDEARQFGVDEQLGVVRLILNDLIDDIENAEFIRIKEHDVWSNELWDGEPTPGTHWVPQHLLGVGVVVYEEREGNVIHPIPFEKDGTVLKKAYYPVRPDIIERNLLVFKDRLFPLAQPTNINSNLGGYFVVSPDIACIYAYTQDPVSGRIILSDQIRLRINIPTYLTGVGSSEGIPIPYGFGFITEEFNVGAGVGGANFLTINPQAEGINALNLNLNMNIGNIG